MSPLLSCVASSAAPPLYFCCRLRMRMPFTGIQILVPLCRLHFVVGSRGLKSTACWVGDNTSSRCCFPRFIFFFRSCTTHCFLRRYVLWSTGASTLGNPFPSFFITVDRSASLSGVAYPVSLLFWCSFFYFLVFFLGSFLPFSPFLSSALFPLRRPPKSHLRTLPHSPPTLP